MDRARTEALVRQLLIEIGEDPDRDGLRRTPARVAASLEFLVRGQSMNLEEVVHGAIFEQCTNDMIVVRNIELYSLCEHHILPFFGRCHIGYIAKGKVLGASKLARIVELYARRLQIQERLTNQIARAVMDSGAGAQGVGVVVEAQHLCMMMRGVEKQNSLLTTSSVLGSMHDSLPTRSEFMNLISKRYPA
jgi:GTP cyclohydrolase I